MCVSGFLILFGAPLLIGYFIGGQKNIMWRNLGGGMLVAGFLLIMITIASN